MVLIVLPRKEVLTAALLRAGVPVDRHGEFVRFEMQWGGRSEGLGDDCHWGIVHRAPRWGNSNPGEVSAEWDEESGLWYVVCADVHPSDTWMLDEQGHLWDGGSPSASPGHFSSVMQSWS